MIINRENGGLENSKSKNEYKLNSDCDNEDLKVHENGWCKQFLRYEESSDLFHCS